MDDGEGLRTNIVANIASYLHPTSTVPIGADSDLTAVVDAWSAHASNLDSDRFAVQELEPLLALDDDQAGSRSASI